MIYTGEQEKVEMRMAKAAEQANAASQERFAGRIINYFAGRTGVVLAVWGLAFKAKTDDVRESPAINCVKKLLERGMKIRAYDPEAATTARAALGGKIDIFENGYDALGGADALVILTEWQEFRNPDFELITKKLKKPVIFDGRNLYDPEVVRKAGIEYYSVGRPAVK
jgi:UDPglucose 6-dehydrogenase